MSLWLLRPVRRQPVNVVFMQPFHWRYDRREGCTKMIKNLHSKIKNNLKNFK